MKLKTLLLTLALSASTAAFATDVQIVKAWVRPTAEGQKATGAFMTITAKEDAVLLAASSPAAGVVEVHEMKMDGGVMKMRQVAGGLKLPAGKAVELKPGGYHIMLMDLKARVKEGEQVMLTLVIQGADGQRQNIELTVPARPMAGKPAGGMSQGHGHSMKH